MTSPGTPVANINLRNAILAMRLTESEIQERLNLVREEVMTHSKTIRDANFTSISTSDLKALFESYDRIFFAGLLKAGLIGRPLYFRLSPRMTRAGGKTTRAVQRRSGTEIYEIAIAVDMLFDGFRGNDRNVTVSGITCNTRFEAVQRIFEHELIHLTELLCWGKSSCSAERFQDIAGRLFLHAAHTHELITRSERAANAGIHPGSTVSFRMDGKKVTGQVNRISKRATVLVPDSTGRSFSDGVRYATYYVPLGMLELDNE